MCCFGPQSDASETTGGRPTDQRRRAGGAPTRRAAGAASGACPSACRERSKEVKLQPLHAVLDFGTPERAAARSAVYAPTASIGEGYHVSSSLLPCSPNRRRTYAAGAFPLRTITRRNPSLARRTAVDSA